MGKVVGTAAAAGHTFSSGPGHRKKIYLLLLCSSCNRLLTIVGWGTRWKIERRQARRTRSIEIPFHCILGLKISCLPTRVSPNFRSKPKKRNGSEKMKAKLGK
jgi:hypothetical protein